MKKLHIGLLPRIIIAIALGILLGNFLPGGMATEKKGNMPCASLTSSSGTPGSIR